LKSLFLPLNVPSSLYFLCRFDVIWSSIINTVAKECMLIYNRDRSYSYISSVHCTFCYVLFFYFLISVNFTKRFYHVICIVALNVHWSLSPLLLVLPLPTFLTVLNGFHYAIFIYIYSCTYKYIYNVLCSYSSLSASPFSLPLTPITLLLSCHIILLDLVSK
jgi:hypothetical protein